MIDFIVSIVLTLVLIISFSHIRNFPEEKLHGSGYVPKHTGESSLVVPGDGNEMANAIIIPETAPDLTEEEEAQIFKTMNVKATVEKNATNQEETQEENQELKEEHKKVNEMIIAFWHGVAAVLIGEASALLVAWAWMKIRGGK